MVHPEILKELAFFRGLTKPVLEQIAEHSEIREYTNNEVISTQHDRAIAIYKSSLTLLRSSLGRT
jgi:hypothetical protein